MKKNTPFWLSRFQQGQVEHVLRFAATEKHKNASHALGKQLAECREQCALALCQNLGGLPDMLALRQLLLDAERRRAGAQAELRCLRRVVDELADRHASAQTEKQALTQKHQRIQDFTQIAVGDRFQARELARRLLEFYRFIHIIDNIYYRSISNEK